MNKQDAIAQAKQMEYAFVVRTLNERGMKVVGDFVELHAADPSRHDKGAWYSEAEHAESMTSDLDESIHVEMPARYTFSGNPEIVKLEDDCWDYSVSR